MQRNDTAGFTLIEVLIAMSVLSIGIMAMYSMQITSLKGNATANRITAESTWAADQIETMVAMDYADFKDSDSDGTNQDQNLDGVDDDGEDFGLSDIGTNADGSRVTADGFYSVFWNVAEDLPAINAKTVRIIVQHNTNGKRVQLQYIKTDPLL